MVLNFNYTKGSYLVSQWGSDVPFLRVGQEEKTCNGQNTIKKFLKGKDRLFVSLRTRSHGVGHCYDKDQAAGFKGKF